MRETRTTKSFSVGVRGAEHLHFSPRLRGWYEFMFDSRSAAAKAPFNGQAARVQLMSEIIDRCGVERFVETGTKRGDTTAWFAAFGLPVISAEIVPHVAWSAKYRFVWQRNVNIRLLDSVEMLKGLAAEPGAATPRTLFYLDAHWHEVLPLGDEARLVRDRFPNSIIFIDDFQVPDDPGYRYDDYGPDQRLTLDYLWPAIAPNAAIYFPSTPSEEETGARRGSVVIASAAGINGVLDEMPGLRRWEDRPMENERAQSML